MNSQHTMGRVNQEQHSGKVRFLHDKSCISVNSASALIFISG